MGRFRAAQRLTYYYYILYVLLQVNGLMMDSSHSFILRYSYKWVLYLMYIYRTVFIDGSWAVPRRQSVGSTARDGCTEHRE